jgi:hypothetical protein
VTVEGACGPDYPLQKAAQPGIPAGNRAFAAPNQHHRRALRVRSAAAFAIHKFFQESGCLRPHADAEGAGEMFRVTTNDPEEFFGKPAHLTVSGQLQGEAMAMAYGKIYTFGPTFRAEKSYTQRQDGSDLVRVARNPAEVQRAADALHVPAEGELLALHRHVHRDFRLQVLVDRLGEGDPVRLLQLPEEAAGPPAGQLRHGHGVAQALAVKDFAFCVGSVTVPLTPAMSRPPFTAPTMSVTSKGAQ